MSFKSSKVTLTPISKKPQPNSVANDSSLDLKKDQSELQKHNSYNDGDN